MPSPSTTFTYDNEKYNYHRALTKWGYRIFEQIGTNPDDYLWASIGYFDSSRHQDMDMCDYFIGYYHNISSSKARLMTMKEKLTLVRPVTSKFHQLQSNWDPEKLSLNSLDDATHAGYYGSRRAVELRMTSRMDFDHFFEIKKQQESNGSWLGYIEETRPIKAVRFYGKSFCDGCQPIAELGQMFCQLECKVTQVDNSSFLNVEVQNSYRRPGTQHRMGVSFPSTSGAIAETVLRIILMLYVMHILLNVVSNVTVSNEERYFRLKRQGAPPTVLISSLVNRPLLNEFLKPETNNIITKPFTLSFFMYNSDVFVFLNLVVVCLSFMTSMQLKHEIVWWSVHHETFRSIITRIAVNAKMMWLYLACIKLYKHILIRLSPDGGWAPYTLIHSHLFVWFWFIYLSMMTFTGYDFLLDPIFKDRIDIVNNYELMNDISVTFEYGFYFIRIPSVVVHTISASLLGFILLIGFQEASGTSKRDNSLFCTMARGSSMLIFDPQYFQNDITKQTSLIPLTSLMNLKWFMKTQCQKYNHINHKYGLFTGKPIPFSNHFENEVMEAEAVVMKITEVTVLWGDDGNVHYLNRATGNDLEESAEFYKLLESKQTIRII